MLFLRSPWRLNLLMIFTVWGSWFYLTGFEGLAIIQDHAIISITMIFGSFIAGASSEGGGAIAFPVFTKLLAISPLDAKVFSLAIQSIGMTAASLTIMLLKVPVNWAVILWATLGGCIGLPIGAFMIASELPASLIKMLFTAMISSFAWTLFTINWQKRAYNLCLTIGPKEAGVLFFTGFIGGLMTGLIGNGIDIICFSVMVLLFRFSEKVSTPTSVILMAINSIFGFALYYYLSDAFSSTVKQYWLAAIPVVVIFAPCGAYCCTRMSNKTIAGLLIVLISLELFSSLWLIPLTAFTTGISLLVFILFLGGYLMLSKMNAYTPRSKL